MFPRTGGHTTGDRKGKLRDAGNVGIVIYGRTVKRNLAGEVTVFYLSVKFRRCSLPACIRAAEIFVYLR